MLNSNCSNIWPTSFAFIYMKWLLKSYLSVLYPKQLNGLWLNLVLWSSGLLCLQNICSHLQDCTALWTRRPQSPFLPLWKCRISFGTDEFDIISRRVNFILVCIDPLQSLQIELCHMAYHKHIHIEFFEIQNLMTPWYPLDRSLGSLQSQSGHSGRQKNPCSW
jgi:hypothetical protein